LNISSGKTVSKHQAACMGTPKLPSRIISCLSSYDFHGYLPVRDPFAFLSIDWRSWKTNATVVVAGNAKNPAIVIKPGPSLSFKLSTKQVFPL